jgi:hypothetical protein
MIAEGIQRTISMKAIRPLLQQPTHSLKYQVVDSIRVQRTFSYFSKDASDLSSLMWSVTAKWTEGHESLRQVGTEEYNSDSAPASCRQG